MNGSQTRFVSLIVVGALAFAACGGDDEAATVVSSADRSETAGTVDSVDSVDSGSPPTSADTTESEEASGDGSVEGDPDSEYCRAVRGEIEMPGEFGTLESLDFTDSEAMQEMLEDAEANLSQAVSIAPEGLRADFELVLESSMSMISQLVENGGDLSAIDASNFDDPEFEAAAERLDTYNVEVCGYDAATATMPAAVDPGTMSDTLETLLAPLQAQMNLSDEQITCLSDRMASSMTESGGTPDIGAVMNYFTDCGIDPAAGG
jgi:hypothetical protein